MVKNLYRNYDEQREVARRTRDDLKHRSMECMARLQRPLEPAAQAALRLEFGKLGFEQSELADAVKRVCLLESADHQVTLACEYFRSVADATTVRKQLADCGATLARIKIAQGAPYNAEVDLREAVAVLGTSINCQEGSLRDNLLQAAAELAAVYIGAGQAVRVRDLYELF